MERTPEPELMDSQAQTRAYAEADFSESNSLFVSEFMAAFPELEPRGNLADLGCGPADICIRMAGELKDWQLTGLDAGENMLKRAAAAINTAGMQNRITLRLSYLPDDQLEDRAYDAVISNSLLHHLPDPMTLWHTIARIGRPGAAVTVMDLSRPETHAQAGVLVDVHANGAPEILREDFYNSLLAAYTPDEIRQQLVQAGLAHLKLEIPSDRHWIVTGRLEA